MNKESLQEQVDQHRRTSMIIPSIVTKCHGLIHVSGVTVIHRPLEPSPTWQLSWVFLFLLATCDQLLVKDASSGHLLISKLKQYTFRDFIGCVMGLGWPCTSIHFVFFSFSFWVLLNVMPIFTMKKTGSEWKRGHSVSIGDLLLQVCLLILEL